MTRLSDIFKGSLLSMALAVLMTACSNDDLSAPGSNPDGLLTLRAECVEMLPQFSDPSLGSRGTDAKRDEEKAISVLHVFFFSDEEDADGNHPLLTPTAVNFLPYQTVYTNVLTIPNLAFTNTETEQKKVRICVVANVPGTFNAKWEGGEYAGGTILDGRCLAGDYDPDDKKNGVKYPRQYPKMDETELAKAKEGLTPCTITCLEDLLGWVYLPELREDVSRIPENGIPMVGQQVIDNIARQGGNELIYLKSLMARVDISVKLQPNQESRDGRLPTMNVTEYGIKNMPMMVGFTASNTTDSDIIPDEERTPFPVTDRNVKVETSYLSKDSPAETYTYYTYENVQNRDPEAKIYRKQDDGTTEEVGAYNEDGSFRYPKGIDTDEERQRYKPVMARKDKASALVLRADYTTHQGLHFKAEFTVYMGKDPIKDFRVIRNCQYNNNIVISGLDYVRNSTDGVYTFDGRVNVKTPENAIYLAIVNERKVDAHASVRPMDVWFLFREPDKSGDPLKEVSWQSQVTLTILDHEKVDWIRMETVPRAEMEAGNYLTGTGCRDYFTHNLVKSTSNGIKGIIAENGSMIAKTITNKDGEKIDCVHHYGWEVTIDGDIDKSRSRVYFYIDENVTPNADGNIPDRTAQVQIVYTRSQDGVEIDRRERILEIEQRGLLKVEGKWIGNGILGIRPEDDIPTTYMEYYEEYLEHSDPLDKHIQPGVMYDGLYWGLENVRVERNGFNNPESGHDYYDVFYKTGASVMTKWAVDYSGEDVMKDQKLIDPINHPASAFHYCYGRNKRNEDGTVWINENLPNSGWYMPGIRELELALVKYYATFKDFQGNYYWSAAPAMRGFNDNYARATQVTMVNGQPRYVESGLTQNGRQERSKINRIRAFYRINLD